MYKKICNILIILSLWQISCEKGIIEQPDNKYQILDTEDDLAEGINAAYKKLAEALNYHFILSAKSDDINLLEHLRRSGSNDTLTECKCSEREISIEQANDFYRLIYKSILMTNKIIHSFKNNKIDVQLQSCLGEAYFLRAYNYYKLTRVFGRLPLVTDLIVNYNIPLATYTEIYNQIESDLIKSQEYLPENRPDARLKGETPYVATANALLAEVYLTMGGYPVNDQSKYQLAAETALSVINNKDRYGIGLVEDFANLWKWNAHDNKESLWLLYYENPHFFGHLLPERSFMACFPNNYRKHITFWYHKLSKIMEGSEYTEQLEYIEPREYSSSDLVYYNNPGTETFVWEDMSHSQSNLFYCIVAGKKQVINSASGFDNASSYSIDKLPYPYLLDEINIEVYLSRDTSNGIDIEQTYDNYINHNKNFYSPHYYHMLRYAHVLLTYAEARARSGTLDNSAYEAINKVRRRANNLPLNAQSKHDLTPGLSNAAFADSVVKERGWEFCHEIEGRWSDIIRLQCYDKIKQQRYENDLKVTGFDNVFEGHTYFIPLPEEDIHLNPNIELNDSLK